MPKAVVTDGYTVDEYIPSYLRDFFYKSSYPDYTYTTTDGRGPYDFSTNGLVFYAPLFALKDSPFKSVDAYEHTCTPVVGALWQPDGRAFDGNDSIDTTPVLTNALASLTIGTIGVWVKVPDATPAPAEAIITFGDTDGNEYLRLLITTAGKFGCNTAIAGVASWSLDTNNAVFSDNVWAYAELIHDGISASARINGVAVDQTLTDHNGLTAWFSDLTGLDNSFIGKSSFDNNANRSHLTGTIGEVIIHNRALPTAEGLHNYNITAWRYR
ncbi:hypothetical protein LCGC14_0514750 [marine sediment metagenome]|uniref:LamG-like jellyroll fold domain-containing protein n=1 Tax=marine sediment metagenome TaxID=412755 RepID=A0A0F9ULV7_9ZZZZ